MFHTSQHLINWAAATGKYLILCSHGNAPGIIAQETRLAMLAQCVHLM